MSRYVLKLPDLGEGTVEAEIVSWRVKPGDEVSEDDVLAEVMTEKAAVEVPAPVSGKIISIAGQPGERVAVGSELVVLETSSGAAGAAGQPAVPPPAAAAANGGGPVRAHSAHSGQEKRTIAAVGNGAARQPAAASADRGPAAATAAADSNRRVLTSPAIRRRAKEAGIDLREVAGSGPQGRIVRQDFEAYAAARSSGRSPAVAAITRLPAASVQRPAGATEEIKVIGLRRLIAQRMSEAKRNIPHFSYVEEVDVTELETLRRHLNTKLEPGTPALTYLPFLALALVRVLEDFPQCNAHYDAERGVIVRYRAVHLGVATQTPEGLKVPVVRDVQQRSLWDVASEMRRATEAARTNKATREELSGSTITLTSLGKLGGIASTPIINAPEVSIIGINRAVERPVVIGGAITVRRMMNLSSSFDHRFVDGYDAAAMIQALKERVEHPATIFIG
ncbi:MAG TPA: dihydrolipoamide acetyltransferase family protein [Steroidobacteraceae bacterium]|jgi:2-oxoisovalerate dehydrogenase E2 component (dihydrolipoyl transacylase)|nr:dihydrolipoamide acetyltransferase family protein [Steroidobacteraceae bacterium]